MSLKSLSGKSAVITGGASGLGLAIAESFAENGCVHVALLDINQSAGEKACQKLSADFTETQFTFHQVDVTKQANVFAAFEEARQVTGHVDIAVAGAGITTGVRGLVDITEEDVNRVLGVNVAGVLYTCQAAAKAMAQTGGSIIIIASIAGNVAMAPLQDMLYGCSKGAVRLLAKNLGVNLVSQNIRVNSISPGYIETPMTITNADTEQKRALIKGWNQFTPMGRMGKPKEVTGLVTLLASDAASYMAGGDYLVDGGLTAW